MAYNKAREEKKWRIWKQAEEKKLHQLGVFRQIRSLCNCDEHKRVKRYATTTERYER